jgi:putative PEP-CTERM system histidine kinase
MEQLSDWSINIGVVAYGLAALAYLGLMVLLVTSWRGRLQGGLFLAACGVTMVWAAFLAVQAVYGYPFSLPIFLFKVVRDGLWFWFLLRLLAPESEQAGAWRLSPQLRRTGYIILGLCAGLLLFHLIEWRWPGGQRELFGYDLRLPGHLLLAIAGLALVEQLFRNTPSQQRWAIKYLCLGLGGGFAYDFFMYADAVLFGRLDPNIWDARGFVQFLTVPLIAIAAARNPVWSLDIFISRGVVFHTTAVLTAGAYLLLMAAGGYFIRYWGGEWGTIAQLIFFFGAGLVLLVLLFSGQIRSRFKVFLSKHFFSYKYDYRDEWLNFTTALTSDAPGPDLRERVIQAMAKMVDSPGGVLWFKDDVGQYALAASWNLQAPQSVSADDAVVGFMRDKGWLINLNEYHTTPEIYDGLRMPEWIEQIPNAWLVIPLVQQGGLCGLLLLQQPRAPREINWEDRDLLKTAASQAASYLALAEASAALAAARQFEAFNRLSAYVVHDLKNVVGQLSLVTVNAKRFGQNPAFMADAMATVENSVAKMQKMLAQLRQGRQLQQSATAIKLLPVVEEVIRHRSSARPVPELVSGHDYGEVAVVAEHERLAAVIEHVVQNAQEATAADGWIKVRLVLAERNIIIEIEDSGCGMDETFIRDRLFKPFDTTKGNAGMGIGAYECREFLRGIGGNVSVVSTPGVGTLFQLHIPSAS